MRTLVTGVAGFIGSHLAEGLLAAGHEVTGVDCFTEAYDPAAKSRNLAEIRSAGPLTFVESDLRDTDLDSLIRDKEVVFHLAAMPGVRASWSRGFENYVEHNILATQRLLEAAVRVDLPRLVYASSSSVYGNADRYPVLETDVPAPHSPYGVTKLAAEQLCRTYADVFGLHTVSLRYFSVYGPRQRPDMGVHRIIEAALGRWDFTLYGDGTQVRDMTFVSDVVGATVAAAMADTSPGEVFNIAGGSQVSVRELLHKTQTLAGENLEWDTAVAQPGDVRRTGGDTDRARDLLGWKPKIDLEEGLQRQVLWHQQLPSVAASAT